MKILAIETSCEHASVALLADGTCHDLKLEGHANHSERLLSSIRGLMAAHGIALVQLDAIAFGAGPGAFTGLRLACGAAQGLAMGAGVGVVPVSSLEAIALGVGDGDVFVGADARMGEVYAAAYRVDGEQVVELQAPLCCPPEALRVPEGRAWRAAGSALHAYAARLPAETTARFVATFPDAVPEARAVARIAARSVAGGQVLPPEHAGPLYVRDKVAMTTAERIARGGRA